MLITTKSFEPQFWWCRQNMQQDHTTWLIIAIWGQRQDVYVLKNVQIDSYMCAICHAFIPFCSIHPWIFTRRAPLNRSKVTRLTGWRCTRAPMCFFLSVDVMIVSLWFLVWLLHHVWNFHLVGLLRPSAYQNVATLHFVFCKALCIKPSVSAIQFTSYLFLARAKRRLSTGTGVCQRWAIQACVHTIQSRSTP